MRTTLDLDEDILSASKELARRRGTTAGRVISDLLREALAPDPIAEGVTRVLGFRPFPARGTVVTTEIVERLREDGEY